MVQPFAILCMVVYCHSNKSNHQQDYRAVLLSLNFDLKTKVGLTAAEENDKVIEQNKDL
jgi:hypothetical protein